MLNGCSSVNQDVGMWSCRWTLSGHVCITLKMIVFAPCVALLLLAVTANAVHFPVTTAHAIRVYCRD
jgi:hypothetical protein